ncbi:MAG: hypothetical protein IJR71_01605 [Prevotella sp.]|nr:hypothetical protein [Prevotella sp.]
MDAININNAIGRIKEIEQEIAEVSNALNKKYSVERRKMPDDVKQSRMDLGKAIGHLRRAKFFLVQAMASK